VSKKGKGPKKGGKKKSDEKYKDMDSVSEENSEENDESDEFDDIIDDIDEDWEDLSFDEMAQMAKPLIEQGLKGDELRNHPHYQKLMSLEKEITQELRGSSFYTEEIEAMIKQGMGLSQKILKAYDPLEEEIKKLNYGQNLTFQEFALTGEKLIDLWAGIKIDRSDISIKRIDKALSWAGIPKKADPEKFKYATASLIGEIIIKNHGGEWIKEDNIIDSCVKTGDKIINPFKWYEEKLIRGEKTYLYEQYKSVSSE